jgi:hypothetical protein
MRPLGSGPVGIGIVGCGTIAGAYLATAPRLPQIRVVGLADLRPEAAEARAAEFGVPAMGVAELIARPEVEIVVNLTIPQAHVEVGLQAIAASKHTYSEKPLAVALADAARLLAAAGKAGVRVGCAPDTFLGGGHQTARALVDAGAIGTPVGGTAFFLCPGHERWHPSPAFYYARGGGPMLDMGPYYVTSLVSLLGPVARVSGSTGIARPTRTITSEPLKGTVVPVEVATHVAGTLELASGAIVSIAMSFDVARHRHAPIELYGTEAAMQVPDPNRFGGTVELARPGGEWEVQPLTHAHALGNWRILGVADMADAIRRGRPHRASGALAHHVLEVMLAFQQSSDSGRHVMITSGPERPAALPAGSTDGVLD